MHVHASTDVSACDRPWMHLPASACAFMHAFTVRACVFCMCVCGFPIKFCIAQRDTSALVKSKLHLSIACTAAAAAAAKILHTLKKISKEQQKLSI